MNLNITDSNNNSVGGSIAKMFSSIVERVNRESGKIMSESMTKVVRDHISFKYPGSEHYNPSKVNDGKSLGIYGETNIDIPGITRAYGNLTIRPKLARALTIPLHQSAFGKKATEFDDLFIPKGKNILARSEGGQLVAMYALASSVNQKQDKSLMPADSTLANNIFKALTTKLNI